MFDPQACCGDLGWPVVSQPGDLRTILARAGKSGVVRVVYQPKQGNLVEHWENVAWLVIRAENIILMVDEVDSICSAGSAKNSASLYWKKYPTRMPALDHLVQYGRHSHVAMVCTSRAPQDVWRRLTGQSGWMLVFKMNEPLELDAVRGRLGRCTAQLPQLGKYQYLDWEDGGTVSICGGKLS